MNKQDPGTEVEAESERCFHEIITRFTLLAELFFRLLYFGSLDMTDVRTCKGKKWADKRASKQLFHM